MPKLPNHPQEALRHGAARATLHDSPFDHALPAFVGALLLIYAALLSGPAQAASRGLPDFTDLVEDESDAIVNISTRYSQGNPHNGLPRGMDPDELPEWFRRFFRGGPEGGPQRERRSLGSGFILSADGYVLTNNHVVEDASEVLVTLNDRRVLEAEIIGTDPRSDLALLKVQGDDLPHVEIGRSEDLEVGEWVLAIGSPFGFDHSVTAGIVSATGRSLPTERGENYVPFIQTDVAINPGNSGGPLFDLDGRVIGINSQIYTRSGGFMGLSFAIPIDVAMEVVEQLKDTGSVARGWLGVQINEVSRDDAEALDLDRPQGAVIVTVQPDSPAEDAGLEPSDVILRFDGELIERSGDLPHVVGRIRPGSEVNAEIVRLGERLTLPVVVGRLPDGGAPVASREAARQNDDNPLAVTVVEVPQAVRERFDLEGGVQIQAVEPGPAARAGLRAGDVITRLNRVAVDSVETFTEVASELPKGRSVPVLFARDGVATFVAIRIPEDE